MKTILISEPNAPGDCFYLPYVWAVLKTYWEQHGSDAGAFNWLDPVIDRTVARTGMDEHAPNPPDVVGLSCYTWNWELNCAVAQWAKRRNPSCLVVAGGPDPDYKDPDFFVKYPYIDIVVVKDGEVPFTRILETVLAGGSDFGHIPGLFMPNRSRMDDPTGVPMINTGPPEVPTAFDNSPYIAQSGYYERLLRQTKKPAFAIWETNRGCPYSCNYCDWGSSTMSRLRRFDMPRVAAEADWFGRMKVYFLMMADANFGILPRDVEVMQRLIDAKQKYGMPQLVYYSSAKNNVDRVVEIAKMSHAAGLTLQHTLAVQHTDQEVLKHADRSNIPAHKYREIVSRLQADRIPCEVQLIFGIPGDSMEKWKNNLGEVMEWGIHGNFQVSPYALLPNAPAAEPEFRNKWQIKTIERALIPYGGILLKNAERDTVSNLIVGWNGFSEADWVETISYTSVVRALHNRALTLFISLYFRFSHDVAYRDFYDFMINDFITNSPLFGPLYQQVKAVYTRMIEVADSSDRMELEQFPDCPFYVDPCKWFYVNVCLHIDSFYRELGVMLAARFPQAHLTNEVLDYQRRMMVLPDYDSTVGMGLTLSRDWPGYFRAARLQVQVEPIPPPVAFAQPCWAEIPAEARAGRSKWWVFGVGTGEQRSLRWLRQVVNMLNISIVSTFPDPVVVDPPPPPNAVTTVEQDGVMAALAGAEDLVTPLHLRPSITAATLAHSQAEPPRRFAAQAMARLRAWAKS